MLRAELLQTVTHTHPLDSMPTRQRPHLIVIPEQNTQRSPHPVTQKCVALLHYDSLTMQHTPSSIRSIITPAAVSVTRLQSNSPMPLVTALGVSLPVLQAAP